MDLIKEQRTFMDAEEAIVINEPIVRPMST